MSKTGASSAQIANQWRRFNFFEVLPIIDPSSTPIYSDNSVTSVAAAKDKLYLGTRSGVVRQVSKDLDLVTTWPAHPESSVDFIKAHPNLNILFTVSDVEGQPTSLSVWNTSKATPKLVSSVAVTNGTNTHPLTAFTCSNDANVLAFGYADGAVVLVRGDIVHDRGSRQRTICTLGAPITGLFIVGEGAFVVSLQQILMIPTTGARQQKILEKNKGAELNCSALHGDQLVVCRDNDITFYHPDHRGAIREFEAQKRAVSVYKHYLVLVTVHEMLNTPVYRVVIMDTLNDIIVYDGQLAQTIRHVFHQWNQLFIIGNGTAGESILYSLREKPVHQQLDILKQQQLYSTAIKLAQNAGCDPKVIMGLHQDYGDYLDDKGDAEQALENYCLAIDLGDSSHVIMRYKDSHKVAILAQYLEELDTKGMASPAHLTLLLVCYTNIKDAANLRRFAARAVKHPKFEFEKAVEICRKAHYPEVGAFIAEKWPEPDLVVQIKTHDLQDYRGCLDYIHTISVSDALWVLIQNSRVLLNKLPVETTSLLITLFTGKFVQRKEALPMESAASSLLEDTAAPLLQSYQAFIKYISLNKVRHVDHEALQTEEYSVTYQPPRPNLIFPSFIGHDNEFVIFLEACLQNADQFQPSDKDLSDIVTTLYQVYMSLAKRDKAGSEWRSKAQLLIKEHHEVLDSNTVLMVTELNHVKLDTQQLRRLGSSYPEIFREFVSQSKMEGAVQVLGEALEQSSGDECAECLQQALSTLATSKTFFELLRPRISEMFSKCIDLNVVSPAQLLKSACSGPYMTLGDIRPFLVGQIAKIQSDIEANTKISDSYLADIEQKQGEIGALTHEPLMIQPGSCSICAAALELPAVHFACLHSYHKRCLGDSSKCPLCKSELESIDAIRSAELQEAARSEQFFESLATSSDQLRTLTDFISKGALMGN